MEPKWLTVARKELGVTEKAGKAHNSRIIEYFAAAGHNEVKDDETAWCSAFVNFCMEQAGVRGTMSLAAQSWLRWGKKVKPTPGCVLIFKRGTQAWQGHVTLLIEETPTHFRCLGGNQSNKVCISSYAKAGLMGARWPVTVANSKTVKTQVVTAASSAVAVVGEQAQSWQMIAQDWANYIDWMAKAALGLAVVGGLCTLWFKIKSIKDKGA